MITTDILQWIVDLHKRAPRCKVVLVASHCDALARPENQEALLQWVEGRVRDLHEQWKKRRRTEFSQLDSHLVVRNGVLAVGCRRLEEDAPSVGLREVMDLLRGEAKSIFVPHSWVLAGKVLDDLTKDIVGGGASGSGALPRPWIRRRDADKAFERFAQALDDSDPSKGILADGDARKEAMDGAVTIR